MIAALRRIPGPLLVAQLGALGVGLYLLARALVISFDAPIDRSDSTTDTLLAGSWFAVGVLTIVGLAWWKRRATGRALTGVRIALWAASIGLAFSLGWTVLSVCDSIVHGDLHLDDGIAELGSLGRTGTVVVLAVGLGLATRRWYWAAIGGTVAFVTCPPWFLAEHVLGPLQHNFRTYLLVQGGMHLTGIIMTLLLMAIACRDLPANSEAPRPSFGLRRIGHALLGLAISTAVLVGFGLLVEMTDAGGATLATYRIAVVLSAMLELASLIALALAALDAARGRTELPNGLLIASAAAALCVAGNTLFRIFALSNHYFSEYFTHSDPMSFTWLGFPGHNDAFIAPPSAQLLTTCAIGCVMIAIGIAARRRNLDLLRARTMVLAGIFVGLALAAVTAHHAMTPWTTATRPIAAALVASTAALIASWVIAAAVVRRGSEALVDGSNLPAAKLVRR